MQCRVPKPSAQSQSQWVTAMQTTAHSLRSMRCAQTGRNHFLDIFQWFLKLWHQKNECTPQKSKIDTKNGHVWKESPFSEPSFWVSIAFVNFRDVCLKIIDPKSRMAPYWHYTLTVHISMEFSKGIYNTLPPIIVEVKNGSPPVVVTIQIQPFSTSRIMGVINNEAIHVPGCIFGGLEVHIPNHGISPPPQHSQGALLSPWMAPRLPRRPKVPQ